MHEGKKYFNCDHCDKSCSTKASRNDHIAAIHDKKKAFDCQNCKVVFGTNSALTRHISTVHIICLHLVLPSRKFKKNLNMRTYFRRTL